MMETRAASGTKFSRIAQSIGSGHFMTRFRANAPQSVDGIMPKTPVKRIIRIVKKAVEPGNAVDATMLDTAYNKVNETLRHREASFFRLVWLMPAILFGGGCIADRLNEAGLPYNTVRVTLAVALALFAGLAAGLRRRIWHDDMLERLKKEIDTRQWELTYQLYRQSSRQSEAK